MFGLKSRLLASISQIEFCRRVTARITREMDCMRQSTEEAALRIGDLVVAIVDTATKGNNELRESISRFVKSDRHSQQDETAPSEDQSRTISEAIERQSELILEMIDRIQNCFSRQLELSQSANSASRRVMETAEQTSRLMVRSKLLAFNVQIEASRLGGEEGRSIAVLGEEMKLFSEDVEKANQVIAESIGQFVHELPQLESETVSIGESLNEFAERFNVEMDDIRQQTQAISEIFERLLDETGTRNDEILGYSHETLSCLQFQDPVAQGLQRASHDIEKLLALFENRTVSDESLAEIKDEIGHDGSEEQESGEVVLF